VIDHLLPNGRQLKTNAHPLIEVTLMRQPKRNRTLIHFVNLSGHSQTAYFPPFEARDITVEVAGEFRRARSTALGLELPVARNGVMGSFTLPKLAAYDAVVLD